MNKESWKFYSQQFAHTYVGTLLSRFVNIFYIIFFLYYFYYIMKFYEVPLLCSFVEYTCTSHNVIEGEHRRVHNERGRSEQLFNTYYSNV